MSDVPIGWGRWLFRKQALSYMQGWFVELGNRSGSSIFPCLYSTYLGRPSSSNTCIYLILVADRSSLLLCFRFCFPRQAARRATSKRPGFDARKLNRNIANDKGHSGDYGRRLCRSQKTSTSLNHSFPRQKVCPESRITVFESR